MQEALCAVFAEEQVTEESADEGADDTQDNGHHDRYVLSAGDQQARQSAGKESNDKDAQDESDHDDEPFY